MLTVVTGGSGSGKSELAENIAVKFTGKKYYIAAMQPFGEEALKRIERHRKMRAEKGFETIEKYTDIDELTFTRKDLVLLECVSNLCANEMFSGRTDKNIAADKIISGIEKINKVVSQLIVVTNEIFSDGILYEKETIEYMKVLGEINRRIFECADNVIESVYGIPYIMKGNLT